ncbi:hypothetical protein [Bradyrhizobium arachidis]|uniref:hypothetical protein n=1 Tax=Bradyrhizobium arachidis TaxID=858423 RepID=UPI003D31EE07
MNWLPWSVLKTSGVPYFASASSRPAARVRQPPRQNRIARPVADGDEIKKAAADGQIGDVGRPHLVRHNDRHVAQQIDLVARRWLGLFAFGPSAAIPILRINRCTRLRFSIAVIRREPRNRPGGEQLVDPPRQSKVVVVGPPRGGRMDSDDLC